jgi:hypothetical protein
MKTDPRRWASAAATILLAGLIVGLPQAAHAATPTLSLTVTNPAHAMYQLTMSGDATEMSYLFVFAQPQGTACGATVSDEANINAPQVGTWTLDAGSYVEEATLPADRPGNYTVCAYLTIPSSDPHQPGPRYAPPAAFASTTFSAFPCSDLDRTFSITHFEAVTAWDSESKSEYGLATPTVSINTPGALVITGPSGVERNNGEVMQPPSIEGDITAESVTPGESDEYTLAFYPGEDGSCLMDDGTIVPTGVGSDFHAAPQIMDVTWFAPAQGGSATVDGVVVPGSSTPQEVPSHTPVITGPSRVGTTDVCSVKVPEGDHYSFGWFVNGKGWASGQTLHIPDQLAGKSLTCAVANHGLDGFPATSSAPVTVGLGHLDLVTRPKLFGSPTAGGAVAVTFGKWAPSAASLDYSYQWFLGSKAIKGAKASNYMIPKSAKGKTISCKETVTSHGYVTTSATTKRVTVK